MIGSNVHAGRPKGKLLRWLYGEAGVPWGRDPAQYNVAAVEKTLESAGRLFGAGRYFKLDVRGFENVPPAPAMIVSNHSGGTTIPDVWGFLVSWYRHFSPARPIHPMAHDIILGLRRTGEYFSARGVLRADPETADAVLRRFRRDLMVMPGGDLDAWRPYTDRFKVRFGGRTGYARLALRAQVPIVPIANAGAHETLLVLTDGRRLAKALRLDVMARAEIFPVHLSLPWGLAVGPWPHLPTPATLRYRIGSAIEPVPLGAGEEPTEALVREHDARVRAAIGALLEELRVERKR
jgi:1-acyl-sn-glycerol-3-phosphate acyltransferase